MRLNEKEIENIICNSVTENLICRALELRPGELAKFICGLANVNGGYILVGVEKDNGLLKPKGLQLAFDMKSIMNSVDKNLDGTCQFGYGYVNVSGKNIFVIKVERAKQKILVDNVYYCFQNNSGEVRQIEEAKRLLVTTTYSMNEIAVILKYKSNTHFGADFKRSTGMTPVEYRKNIRAEREKQIQAENHQMNLEEYLAKTC